MVGLALLLSQATLAFSQVALPPVIDPSGRSGEPGPLEEKTPVVPPPFPLPTPSEPSQETRPAPGPVIRVFVKKINLSGNTVFSDEELALITEPYLNRELMTEDLESLRLALTKYYVDHGYITSGAIIPDQSVTDGEILLEIIEGKLATIKIEGTERYAPSFFESRLALSAGPPVNITNLQERLQLLQQDPRLQRLNAELRPGVVRGESELHVTLKEQSPYRAWVEYNNFQTPVVGEHRGLATFAHLNLLGLGDPFSFTFGRSEGVNPLIDTSYSLPLTPYDTTLIASFRLNDFDIVEAPFDALDIQSQTQIIGFTLFQPIFRSLNQQFNVALKGEWEYNKVESEVLIQGGQQGLIFTPGSTSTGVNIVSALRVIPEWVYRTRDAVLALRSRFSVGLDVLNATTNSGFVGGVPVPDAQFFSWLGQAQAVKRFDRLHGIQVLGRVDLQLANDRLFPLEQFPVGGRYSVRGYRENTLVRDNALLASLEFRIPLWRYASGEDLFQLAPFLDYGNGWNSKDEPLQTGPTPPGYIASVGVGLRWAVLPENRARFEVYWGHQLKNLTQGDGIFQDNGIHMQFVLQVL